MHRESSTTFLNQCFQKARRLPKAKGGHAETARMRCCEQKFAIADDEKGRCVILVRCNGGHVRNQRKVRRREFWQRENGARIGRQFGKNHGGGSSFVPQHHPLNRSRMRIFLLSRRAQAPMRRDTERGRRVTPARSVRLVQLFRPFGFFEHIWGKPPIVGRFRSLRPLCRRRIVASCEIFLARADHV